MLELQEKLQQLVLRELDLFRRTALNTLASADLRQEARQAIETVIDSGAVQLPPTLDRARFLSGALELSWAVEGVRTNELSWLLVHIGRARDALPLGASW